jgi:excisionase family DNA binding protein
MSATESTTVPIATFPDVMTLEECARFLRITPETTLAEFEAGKLPAMKLGGELRFFRKAIEELLSRIPTKAAPKAGTIQAILSNPASLEGDTDMEEFLEQIRKNRQ